MTAPADNGREKDARHFYVSFSLHAALIGNFSMGGTDFSPPHVMCHRIKHCKEA